MWFANVDVDVALIVADDDDGIVVEVVVDRCLHMISSTCRRRQLHHSFFILFISPSLSLSLSHEVVSCRVVSSIVVP